MKRVNAARDELTSQAFGWMIAVPFRADGAVNIARQLYAAFAHSIFGCVLLHQDGGGCPLRARQHARARSPLRRCEALSVAHSRVTGHEEEALRTIEMAMLFEPHPSSFYFYALGVCRFALADYERAIAVFERGIEINPSFMPNHYELQLPMACVGGPPRRSPRQRL